MQDVEKEEQEEETKTINWINHIFHAFIRHDTMQRLHYAKNVTTKSSSLD